MKKKIKNLIKKGENQKTEFKINLENIGKDICSFANTRDGIILVGINDKGKIIGTKKRFERELAHIAHTCKPSIYPEIKEIRINNKTILAVRIKKSDSLHSYKNIAYKRVGSHDKPLSPEEVIEFAKSTGKIRWDEQICREATLKDIDWEFIKNFFIPRYEFLIKKKVTGTDKELLKALNCIRNNKPTNAGILLFGKDPTKFFMNAS